VVLVIFTVLLVVSITFSTKLEPDTEQVWALDIFAFYQFNSRQFVELYTAFMHHFHGNFHCILNIFLWILRLTRGQTKQTGAVQTRYQEIHSVQVRKIMLSSSMLFGDWKTRIEVIAITLTLNAKEKQCLTRALIWILLPAKTPSW
jgi:hypothetical protein